MAEIKIEKKKPVWPWVLLGLVIAAIAIWFFVFRNGTSDADNNNNETTTAPIGDSSNTGVVNNAVVEYVNFVSADTGKMSLDHAFTHNALIKLIDAVSYMADKHNVDLKADLDKAREDADKITDDPLVTTHADYIKDATTRLSTAMQNLQQSKFPNLSAESKNVTDASNNISKADLTLDQKGTVHSFFNNAEDLLKKMNN